MLDLSQLQYSTEYPGLISIVFTVLCSLLLGIVLAITYDRTSRGVYRPDHFLQALILVTIVAACIMQAIGDSVARGLGMIGALSIIRFRTTLRDPRNIVFMFCAISIGIACGVFGYLIAVISTIGFCFTAFMLKYSPFGMSRKLTGTVKISTSKTEDLGIDIHSILRRHTADYVITKTTIGSGKKSDSMNYEVMMRFEKLANCHELIDAFDTLHTVQISSITINKNQFDQI